MLVRDLNICKSSKKRVCKSVAGSLQRIAAEHGELIITAEVDCDAAIAQYATRNKALAVVASDSDFLIYEGDWQFWYTDIQFEPMQVGRYGRGELVDCLQLTYKELKMFATILGNDYMRDARLLKRFQVKNKTWIIADYVRTLNMHKETLNEPFFTRTCLELYGNVKQVENMQRSVTSYEIDFTAPVHSSKLAEYSAENVAMNALRCNGILQYDVNFIDFDSRTNNCAEKTFTAVLIPVLQRLAGILLQSKMNDGPEFKLVIKQSEEDKYELLCLTPIYPESKLCRETITLIFKTSQLNSVA